jgi:hypothetical protein
MAYRLRVQVNVDWIGPGAGVMSGAAAPMLPGGGGTGQTIDLVSASGGYMAPGSGAGGIINATDVTNLTNAMAADIAAQMNSAANLARMQGWVTGQP